MQKVSFLSRIFIAYSGSTYHCYEMANKNDQQRRMFMGIFVFIIVLAGSFVAGLAWAIPMEWPGYFAGFIWFAIMSFLEIIIMQQLDTININSLVKRWLAGDRSNDYKKSGIGVLVFRLGFILAVSYFNSEMMRVYMFKPEIVAEIKIRQDKEIQKNIDSLDLRKKLASEKLSLKEKELTVSNKKLADLVESYDQKIKTIDDSLVFYTSKQFYEVKGPGGFSGKAGDGPIAKAIRKTIEVLEKQKKALIDERIYASQSSGQVSAIKMAEIETEKARVIYRKEIADLDTAKAAIIKQVLSRPVNGLSFMLDVLGDISKRSAIVLMVFILFFLVESSPVVFKFITKNDSYIFASAMEKLREMKEVNQKSRDLVNEINALQ